jgi:hypothetical protein
MSHAANTALLINGPCEGQKHPILAGQQVLEISETFDYDQGRVRKVHGYEYEKPADTDRIAIFVYRETRDE